ncbi:helix-turn-helix domain-containing protein [Dysgonomonas sp. 25]|uniref:helix-turn-helix domain-containing protein n=1 Tax=Dysgonomonas sp. 25 TaxID=2302933 RepID=UPI0013D26656|nr:helix-turn-helix domain-containing protein [Dysgonomonas sp. 25]
MAKYSTSLVSAICELIGEYNLSVNETCQWMRISRKTFYAWCKEKPAFREAIDKAYANRERNILDLLSKEKIIVSRKKVHKEKNAIPSIPFL